MRVTITNEGAVELSRRLQGVSGVVKNLRPSFEKTGDYFLQRIDDNFESRGALFGKPWKRRAKSYPHPILEKTGKMRDSFVKKATRRALVIENLKEDEYFKFHQSRKPRTTALPRRVMMYLDEPMRRKVFANIQAEIYSKFYRRGFKR